MLATYQSPPHGPNVLLPNVIIILQKHISFILLMIIPFSLLYNCVVIFPFNQELNLIYSYKIMTYK